MHSDSTILQSDPSKQLITTLWKFVDVITSHPKTNLRAVPEFRTIIYYLCEKAPEATQAIAEAIQQSKDNISSQAQAMRDTSTVHSGKRKRKPDNDPPYRPPKPANHRTSSPSTNKPSSGPNSNHVHGLAPEVAEGSSREDRNIYTTCRKCSNKHLADQDVSEQEKGLISKDIVETTACEAKKASTETLGIIPVSSEKLHDLARETPERALPPASSAKIISVTPTRLIEDKPSSKEIYREKPPTLDPCSAKTPPITILQATQIIHQLSKYPDAAPREVHKGILQSLQDCPEAVAGSCRGQWSDGSMWIQILGRGSSENNKVTILNMLEYMGAWKWYNGQIELAQTTIRTKKNRPVDRRGAAIHVLNQMEKIQTDPTGQGAWISGVGRVTLEEDNSDILPTKSDKVSVTVQAEHLRRKRISVQLSRGQKLSTKLVKELGYGILFSPGIWGYTKKTAQEIDLLIREIKADSQQKKLLQILGSQLELLVNSGSPDIQAFFQALGREKLISEGELYELQMAFPLEGDALPESELNTAVDDLIKRVSTKVFNKTTLDNNDTISVNESMEFSCDIFQRLREDRWLDSWTIFAAMQISDKPSYIRYDLSIPLDEFMGNNKIEPIRRPLAGWAKKIANHKKLAKETSGLVYFCPINHGNSHFTLLEINEREKAIRHYDSMAQAGTVQGTRETRISKLVMGEFGGLNFLYSEAPTPQQSDYWSCGIRVVWNFRHLSNGLSIGEWDTELNSRRMKLEIVQGMVACVEGNAMRSYRSK